MTTKDILQALLDGNPISNRNKNWDFQYIYLDDNDGELYWGNDDDGYTNQLVMLEEISKPELRNQFYVRLLNWKEHDLLQITINSLKDKHKIHFIQFTSSFVYFFEDEACGSQIYSFRRNDFDLRFENIENYRVYSLGELGLHD